MASNFKKARIDIASRSQTKKVNGTEEPVQIVENTDFGDNEFNRKQSQLRGIHGSSSTNPKEKAYYDHYTNIEKKENNEQRQKKELQMNKQRSKTRNNNQSNSTLERIKELQANIDIELDKENSLIEKKKMTIQQLIENNHQQNSKINQK